MHDHQFDSLARSVTSRSSRRGVVRGAMAGAAAALLAVVRGADTAAHHATIRLGGPCYHTYQCLHHRPGTGLVPVQCADNGFRYDGRLNCCRGRGGACRRDEHCCGVLYDCRNNTCTLRR